MSCINVRSDAVPHELVESVVAAAQRTSTSSNLQMWSVVAVTDAGRVAYRYANDIFSLGQEMLNTLDGRPEGDLVRLRVGVADVLPKPIAAELTPEAVESLPMAIVFAAEARAPSAMRFPRPEGPSNWLPWPTCFPTESRGP